MHPAQLLDDYSLEITSKDASRLWTISRELPAGACVSVTFLPGDAVDDLARSAASVRNLGFTPVPHIAARKLRSEAELIRFLSELRDLAGVDRVLVIAGDRSEPLGPYADALAVIQSGLLAKHGIRRVGITGYPDGHWQIPAPRLQAALDDKLRAIAAQDMTVEIVTQFVFDADAVLNWVGGLRAEGIHAPVRIGVPGPASPQALLRFAARCGVGASAKVMAKYGVSLANLLNTAAPDRLVRQLAQGLATGAGGAAKLHLYPFGGVHEAVCWAAGFARAEPVR